MNSTYLIVTITISGLANDPPVANSDDQRYEAWVVPQPGGSAVARTYRVHSRGLARADRRHTTRLP